MTLSGFPTRYERRDSKKPPSPRLRRNPTRPAADRQTLVDNWQSVGLVADMPHPPETIATARFALRQHRERALRASEGWAVLVSAFVLLCTVVYSEFPAVAAFLLGVASAGLLAGGIDALRYLRLARILRHLRSKEPRT